MNNVKANKRRGHQREAEMGHRTEKWPRFPMTRGGLDGSHDLRGPNSVGEVKAVRSGPAWLSGGLGQLSNSPDKPGFLFTCLSQGQGHPVRWLITMDLDQFERLFINGED